MNSFKIRAAALGAALLMTGSTCLPAAAAESDARYITGNEFCSLQPGMNYDEVLAVVGSAPDKVVDKEESGTMKMQCTWNNKDYSFAILYFENNALTQVRETALITSPQTVTLSQYGQVTYGMSYDQVKAVFGGDGALLSWYTTEDGGIVCRYRFEGTGEENSYCRITFTDGVVTDVDEKNLIN